MTVEKVFQPAKRQHRCRDDMSDHPADYEEGSIIQCECGRYFRAVRYGRFWAFFHSYDTAWKQCPPKLAQRLIGKRDDGEPT